MARFSVKMRECQVDAAEFSETVSNGVGLRGLGVIEVYSKAELRIATTQCAHSEVVAVEVSSWI